MIRNAFKFLIYDKAKSFGALFGVIISFIISFSFFRFVQSLFRLLRLSRVLVVLVRAKQLVHGQCCFVEADPNTGVADLFRHI